MVERSRKTSLHAALAALHSKPEVFFTSSLIPGSLACEVVSLRLRFISLVKTLISFAWEVFSLRGQVCVILTARRCRLYGMIQQGHLGQIRLEFQTVLFYFSVTNFSSAALGVSIPCFWYGAGLDFQKFTHLPCKYSNYWLSLKLPNVFCSIFVFK